MVMRSAVLRNGDTYYWEEPEMDGMELDEAAAVVSADEKDSGVLDEMAPIIARAVCGEISERVAIQILADICFDNDVLLIP